jgi:uncharacterized membrane protein (DUF106 family)
VKAAGIKSIPAPDIVMAGEIEPILLTLYSFYNVAFQPILAMGPYVALGFFSACLAGLFSLIYWYMLDIEKADKIKEKMNKYQEKMKEARKNENTEEASEHMQKTMELNQKFMMLNMKPMIGTMVFVALIFPWLGATFAPTIPLEQTAPDTFTGNLTYAGQTVPLTVVNQTNTTVSTDGQEAAVGGSINVHGIRWDVARFGEHNGGIFAAPKGTILKLNAHFVDLPFSIPLAGDALNWLGFYIIIAMPLTFIFRKLLGVA